MDALVASQRQRIQRNLSLQTQRYQRRVTEAYDMAQIEHKGTRQTAGQGPYNAWKRNVGKAWVIT